MPREEQQSLLRNGESDGRNTRAHDGDYAESLEGEYDKSYIRLTRRQTRQFLGSKLGHYSVLFLVTVDVACIFADFLINLYLCEHECCRYKNEYQGLHDTQDALGVVSLVFSCLFMVELMASIWAFGFS